MGCGASVAKKQTTKKFHSSVLLAGPRPLKKGQLLKDGLTTFEEFELSFDVTAHSAGSSGQRNILRFTATDNNMNGHGDRMPMISFWPGTRLYAVMGRPGCHNAICATPEDSALPVGRPTRITVRLAGDSFVILQDSEELCRCSGFGSRYPGQASVKVWIADKFYEPAHATIANVVYRQATATAAARSQSDELPWWKHDLPLVDIEKPGWWSTWPPHARPERKVAELLTREAIQRLMDATWKSITTRDRGYGCVGQYEVVNVLHNQNRELWERYCRARAGVARSDVKVEQAKTSSCGEELLPACLGELDVDHNEFLLFHGTRPTAAGLICENGFQISKAGSHKGTLYGNGLYFAECSSKSDEYAGDDKEGVYQGLFAMLLCRVCCGNLLETEEVEPDVRELERRCLEKPGARHHAVLGDREKVRGTYREFVVYDADQAYPEFVIIYRRTVAP